MSAPTAPATTGPATPAPEGRLRRHRSTLLMVGAFVLAVVVVVLVTGRGTGSGAPYDPDSTSGDGARAVARVLGDEGVDVTVVRSADDLDATAVDDDTTLVVTSPDQLGPSTADRLLERAGGADLVVVDPSPGVLGLLGLPDELGFADTGDPLAAECTDFDGRFADLEIEVDDATTVPGAERCFGDTLARGDGVTLLGAPQLLTNDQVLRADNAAVALRLLGQHERLVWYVPTATDLAAEESVSLWSLVPDWIAPGLWLLAIATVLLVVWRARRLGPLATEPLPVVVKAVETTLSRGRLYRRSGDRGHAAASLRAGARRRAARRLRLGGSGTDEAALVRAVAHHVGRPESDVGWLLSSHAPPPGSDQDLVSLATALAELDREVRRS